MIILHDQSDDTIYLNSYLDMTMIVSTSFSLLLFDVIKHTIHIHITDDKIFDSFPEAGENR